MRQWNESDTTELKDEALNDESSGELWNEDVLREKVERIRTLGRRYGLNANRIERCFARALNDLSTSRNSDSEQNTSSRSSSKLCKCQTLVIVALLSFICIYWMLACYKPTQTLVSRNVQHLIYPTMRLLRLATIWIHQKFPDITYWHDEQCLVSNSWYKLFDVNCWPCEQIRAVAELTIFPSYIQPYVQNGIPFIVKDRLDNPFQMELIETLYSGYEAELRSGGGAFTSNVPSIKDLKDIFEVGKSQKLLEYNKIHIEWKLKRVSAARVMRQLFPRPSFVPNNTEVSLERYLFIDGPSALSYPLPVTEFANVWLSQKVGRRVVTFQPSPHCQRHCSSISTILKTGDTMYYNWQYWRIVFQPSASGLSVTYMGSFY